MNIKILDSWLKEYVTTAATPEQIAEKLSLTSVSIERVEPWHEDYIYDIEVTTNRPDLASVVGMAREAAAVLPQHHIAATFTPPSIGKPRNIQAKEKLEIENNPDLVYRLCAVVMEVTLADSPKLIKDRLETTGIRSINNIIDVTNYVMRTTGHPTHVLDYDRLRTKTIKIRESRNHEKITTLDGKEYVLSGGDIVADDGLGNIIDLLGVIGLENSVITNETKRIVFFINTDNPNRIRKTSMQHAIRTEAAQLNEKGLDPELAMEALLLGIKLYQDLANGKVVSEIIDIYPRKVQEKKISVSIEKVQSLIGVPITLEKSAKILSDLGFKTTIKGDTLSSLVPSFRNNDMTIPEDIIEEIARVYGYHHIPSLLPPTDYITNYQQQTDKFYLENRVKNAMKYWGFTETYTYSMVSEAIFDGPLSNAVAITNPLGEEFRYMRNSLVPSLLRVIEENKQRESIQIFEIANVYYQVTNNLPKEIQHFAGVIKQKHVTFFDIKGIIEQVATDLGIMQLTFKPREKGGNGADLYLLDNKKEIYAGEIEVLSPELVNFELNFELFLTSASLKKTYKPIAKFPPLIEDISVIIDRDIVTQDIITAIKKQSPLIKNVELFDKYEDARAFHITYQDKVRNLTTKDIQPIRESITKILKEKFKANIKQ